METKCKPGDIMLDQETLLPFPSFALQILGTLCVFQPELLLDDPNWQEGIPKNSLNATNDKEYHEQFPNRRSNLVWYSSPRQFP